MKTYDTGNTDLTDYQGEQEAVARALRNAQALKQQAYGGVPSNANPFHYLANYMSQRNADAEMEAAEKRFGDISSRTAQREADLVSQIATPGTNRVLKQTLGGSDAPLGGQNVAPMTETQQPMSPEEENQRQMGLAMTLGRINPQLAQPFIASGAAFPEKMATLRAQEEAKKEAAMERARQEAIARGERFDQQDYMARLVAGLRPAPQGRDPNAHRQLIEETLPDGTKVQKVIDLSQVPLGTTYGAKPARAVPETAAEKKARHEAGMGIASIDDAIAKLEAPGAEQALGWKNIMPEEVRQYTDPGGVAARAVVANIGSMKLHDRSGAAVTVGEFPRLKPFIPGQRDKAKTAAVKLGLLKEEYQRMQEEWATPKGATPDAAGAPPAAENWVRVNGKLVRQ